MDAKTKRNNKRKYKITFIIKYVLLVLVILSIPITFIFSENYLVFTLIFFFSNLFGFLIIDVFNALYANTLKDYKSKIIEYRDCHHFKSIMELLKDGDIQGARNIYNDCNITNSNIRTYAFTFILSAFSYSDNIELLEIAEIKTDELIELFNPEKIFN